MTRIETITIVNEAGKPKIINKRDYDRDTHTLFGESDKKESLPEGFPHATYFEEAGYDSVESIEALKDMTTVKGISENRASDVKKWLNG